MYGSYGRVANGNIKPGRFVKLDPSAPDRVIQCGVGDQPYGISQMPTRAISLGAYDDGYVAIAGEMLLVYGPADPGVEMVLGAAVTHGDFLKPDSDGRGVPATTDKDKYGARAFATEATVNRQIAVEVVIGQLSV